MSLRGFTIFILEPDLCGRLIDLPFQLNLILLGQSKAQGILRHHLGRLGCQVELGTELVDVEQNDDSVTCRLKKTGEDGTVEEEVLKTDYMVGADGGRGSLDAWSLPVLS